MRSRLSPLQTRVLELLAPLLPRWTLTGGAALAGFHLGHRTTRDLDLFWHGTASLARQPEDAGDLLRSVGLAVTTLQRSASYVRLQVREHDEAVVLDLVAEPVPAAEAPREAAIGTQRILVDTPHEILVNKLGALLHRAEPRDLIDLRGLLAEGGDLRRALADAARKDGGFSPLTAGWSLEQFDVLSRARVLGLDEAEARELDQFRRRLRDEIAALAQP